MDNWDDGSDDDWDKAGDDLALPEPPTAASGGAAAWDDEDEDLAVVEKRNAAAAAETEFKKKGSALMLKKELEAEQAMELELAMKAMKMEAEIEANMTPDERRALARQREEAEAAKMADDLFGGGGMDGGVGKVGAGTAQAATDTVVMTDLKEYLKHARKVGATMKTHNKSNYATSFIKELLQDAKDVYTEDDISDIIKVLNVIKNDKAAAAKRKVKGQANKSKGKDKAAEAKAKKIQKETFGDNDRYDDVDDFGARYEDDFF